MMNATPGARPTSPRPVPEPDRDAEPDHLDPDNAAIAFAAFMAGAVAQMREACAMEVERWAEQMAEPEIRPETKRAAERLASDLAPALRGLSASVDPWGAFDLMAALKRLPTTATASPAELALRRAGLRYAVMSTASRAVEGECANAAPELLMRRWVSLAAYALEAARLTARGDKAICAELAHTLNIRAGCGLSHGAEGWA